VQLHAKKAFGLQPRKEKKKASPPSLRSLYQPFHRFETNTGVPPQVTIQQTVASLHFTKPDLDARPTSQPPLKGEDSDTSFDPPAFTKLQVARPTCTLSDPAKMHSTSTDLTCVEIPLLSAAADHHLIVVPSAHAEYTHAFHTRAGRISGCCQLSRMSDRIQGTTGQGARYG
jgi:hypothetical protein